MHPVASDMEQLDEPLHVIHPITGATIEVFYADRVFAIMAGAGRFWWSYKLGDVPEWPPRGPFRSRDAAYVDALAALEFVAPRSVGFLPCKYGHSADTALNAAASLFIKRLI
jgi:hypothetical protein